MKRYKQWTQCTFHFVTLIPIITTVKLTLIKKKRQEQGDKLRNIKQTRRLLKITEQNCHGKLPINIDFM